LREGVVADEAKLDEVFETERHLFYVACTHALMPIHSFSLECSWFDDFAAFTNRMGQPIEEPDRMAFVKTCEGVGLALAWVKDAPAP